jgi:hypothetical protein
MTDTTIQVPGADSVTINVGDTLTIDFIEACSFCCDTVEVDYFFPQLPLGSHQAGHVWSGVAQQTSTIKFHHKPYGETCGQAVAPMDAGRAITVGDGG